MTGSSDGTDAYVPGHGDATYDVLSYDLDLSYKVEGNHLSGRATLHCRLLVATSALELDLHSLKVTKVTVDGRRAQHRHKRDRLVVALGEKTPAGQDVVVVVAYAGQPRQVRTRHLGSAGWEELTDGALVAGQPHGAPSWFPCNDRPDSKAGYRISLTVPSGYWALANGVQTARTRHSSSTTWVHEQTEPMAAYLATVHVGRYVRVDLPGPVTSWALAPARLRSRLSLAFGRQAEMLETFVEAFGPYPFAEYGVVVTEDELEIPLEAQGFSTFGANFLDDDWSSTRLVAHELAHQWFGNSLTATSWSDIWLHEGFACYAEWLWSEASGGQSADDRAREHHDRLATKDEDFVLRDPGPATMFDDRVYKRGALTLHALRLTVGDDAFFGLLRDWATTHRHSGVSTEAFLDHVRGGVAADRCDAVEALLQRWLSEPELPGLPAAR